MLWLLQTVVLLDDYSADGVAASTLVMVTKMMRMSLMRTTTTMMTMRPMKTTTMMLTRMVRKGTRKR